MPRPRPGRPPTTRYARSGDVHIGYQVVGDGELTVVIVPGFVSSIEQLWDDPDCARFLMRFAKVARLVLFDKRGTGMSDRTVAELKAQTVEHRSDDIQAVLDDVGADRVVVLGISEGASIAIRFAVTYPERVAALALYGGYAVFRPNPGVLAVAAAVRDGWGTGRTLEVFGPSVAGDPAKRRWWARWERLSASPGAVVAHLDVLTRLDVTALLGLVRVPTLVLHRSGDRIVPLAAGQFLADQIPGATLRVHPGDDHLFMLGDADRLALDLLTFITATKGGRPAPRQAAALAIAVTLAGDDLVIRGPSALEVVEQALEFVARTGGRAAVQVEAPGADPDAARALACVRGAVVHAAPGEVLVTGELRGTSWGHGYVHEDRGIHAAVDGAPAVRLFAIRRAHRDGADET